MPSYDQSAFSGRLVEVFGEEAHEQDDGLGLRLEVALRVAEFGQRLGDDVHGRAERDIGGADRSALGVVREAHALGPHRGLEQFDRVLALGRESAEQHDRGRE